MARHEADREDLFSELRACTIRAEWRSPETDVLVTAGLRRNGFCSIYFGGDPVYHFDGDSRLRRAFLDGRLYRTAGHTLSELERTRTATETVLLRRDLSPEELEVCLEAMRRRIAGWLSSLQAGGWAPGRCLPDPEAVSPQLLSALSRTALSPGLAPAIAARD